LNNLTLFGLVLAIGIVVDDAIVVVEAIEHHIEEGMTPRQAAHKAMEEVSGPVVAVALVLSAVFVPCAFISGITGMFFRQFALTWVGFNGLPSVLVPASWEGAKAGSFDLAKGLPAGYIPNQDQGRFYIAVQLPDAASLERTQQVVDRIFELVTPLPGIAHTT